MEFIDRQVLPVGLGSKLDDANVDVCLCGPGTVGTWAEGHGTIGDIASGAAEAEGREGDCATLGFYGKLRINFAHQHLARPLEGDAS